MSSSGFKKVARATEELKEEPTLDSHLSPMFCDTIGAPPGIVSYNTVYGTSARMEIH